MSFRYFDETPQRIIQVFQQWEYAASRSPNPRIAANAPLDPPKDAEASKLLARLQGIKSELAGRKTDWHGRPIHDPVQAAWGYLWEEWRHDRLGELNGYQEVWTKIDPLYDAPEGPKKLLEE